MEETTHRLRQIEGVKTVRSRDGTLKIELFSRELPGGDTWEIKGNLRKIGPKIADRLDKAVKNSEIQGWNWIQKPEKQYTETGIKTEKISDRKSRGHRPPYYTVSIKNP